MRIDEQPLGDVVSISAPTPAAAAEVCCSRYNDRVCEYPAERTVVVTPIEGSPRVFVVTLRSEPVYSARERK